MDEDNKLIPVAMQIILHAGDARTKANQALDAVEVNDYEKATELIKEARENIAQAHQAQTDIIQGEAAGEVYDPCLLFTHAQDTLMTIMTEVNLTERLIQLFNGLNSRFEALEHNHLN